MINAIMRASGDEQILHLVNYNYDPANGRRAGRSRA
jgi:hypothetical protein